VGRFATIRAVVSLINSASAFLSEAIQLQQAEGALEKLIAKIDSIAKRINPTSS
jgi:hypothetical protein